jgi:hypothetical protein
MKGKDLGRIVEVSGAGPATRHRGCLGAVLKVRGTGAAGGHSGGCGTVGEVLSGCLFDIGLARRTARLGQLRHVQREQVASVEARLRRDFDRQGIRSVRVEGGGLRKRRQLETEHCGYHTRGQTHGRALMQLSRRRCLISGRAPA